MAKHWYNEKAAAEVSELDVRICASKKPYFMIWRYDDVRNQYNAFIKSAKKRCVAEFGCSLQEVLDNDGTDPDKVDFALWFDKLNPVQYGHGIMNRLCHMCEDYFANQGKEKADKVKFDPSILKSGVDYSWYTKDKVAALHREYMARLQTIKGGHFSDEECAEQRSVLKDEYAARLAAACINEDEMCDVLVDVCYGKEWSKQFAWDMAGTLMIRNLLRHTGGQISYPTANKRGTILYDGKRFSLETINVEVERCETFC